MSLALRSVGWKKHVPLNGMPRICAQLFSHFQSRNPEPRGRATLQKALLRFTCNGKHFRQNVPPRLPKTFGRVVLLG